MTQSRVDSVMEVVTSTAIGLVVSTIANYFVIPWVLGVTMTHGQNVLLSVVFTAISIARGYAIRRAFNGRTPWAALKSVCWAELIFGLNHPGDSRCSYNKES